MYLSEKKIKRLENRKRKIAALVGIIRLNEQEKPEERTVMENESEQLSSDIDNFSKQVKQTEEPLFKRHRLSVSESPNLDTTKKPDSATPITPPYITMDDYVQLKQELYQRKIFLTRIPRIRVRDDGLKATIDIAVENRIPLFMKDIQHMLAYLLFGPYLKPYNSSPRWCLIEKFNRVENVMFVVFEGLSLDDYIENEEKFQFLNQFAVKVEVINPFSYDGDIVTDVSAVSLTDSNKECLLKKLDNEEAVKKDCNVFRLFKPAFPMQPSFSNDNTTVPDKFPRTSLLLSLWQMVVENYPVLIKGELSDRYSNYRMTKDVYKEVSNDSPLYAIDCEMCLTTANENELTRITVVNEKSEVVYESLVKPHNKITNYLTKFSGITEKLLQHVDKRLEDVQNDIIKLLPSDAILVGHSLNTDLHAMKMMHPYVIDTSVIFNLSGERWRKPKLQALAWQFLNLRIQNDSKGHDSAEDSISSLKLVQLKLSQDISFGDAVMVGKQHLTDRGVNPVNVGTEPVHSPTLTTSIFNSLIRDNKSSFVISTEERIERYRKFVTSKDENNNCQLVSMSSKNTIVRRSCNAAHESKFTLVHIPVAEESKEKCLSRLDKWCLKLWKSVKDNSVCVVLFTGSQSSSSNGVCLVELKRPYVPPRKPKLDNQ